MITLEKWPYNRKEPLEELYANTDQTYCLVQLPVPLPLSSVREYLKAVRSEDLKGRPFLCYAIKNDGAIIGKIEASKDEEGEAELDLIIRRDMVNQGYGSQALGQFLSILKNKDWCSVLCAYVNADNIAIRKVLENSSFVQGRDFAADVMVPDRGTYTMKTMKGTEYIYYFER